MPIDRSAQYFTLAGLTVFKEKVVKNYFKLNEKDAYINGVIYNAMMQHKRDIVKFCASQRALPPVGNAGTLYMVPSHNDNPLYKPVSNEIWVIGTNGFDTMRFKSNNTSEYIDMPKNEYGFFVLDLNKVPSWTGYNCYFYESEETNTGTNSTAANKGSTSNLYKPNITGITTSTSNITSFAQLYELGGKIIAVNEGRPDVNILPLPQLYTGNGTDIRISRNLSEIWISAPYDGEYLRCYFGYGQLLNIYRNSQGFYVLNLGDIVSHKVDRFCVYIPGNPTSYSMYVPGSNAITFSNYNQLVELAGKILAVTLSTGSNISNLETAILPQYTYTGTLPAQYTVPDDEIWVLSNSDTLRVVSGSYDNTLDTKNEYGFFVIKKGVNIPNDLNSYALYIGTINHATFINVTAHVAINNSSSDKTPLYGKIIFWDSSITAYNVFTIIPYDNSETDIVTNIVSGITIPSNEVWIDSANWPTLQIAVYNSSTGKYVPIEVTKNEYGYYVLHQSDFDEYSSNNYYLYCCTKDVDLKDFSNSTYSKYKSSSLIFNDNYLYSSNIFTYAGGRRIVACILGQYVDVIPDTLPIVAYTGANSDRFVTYAYENGKYVTLGNTIFSEKEYPIDPNLDANSIRTVCNSTIYNALKDKYNVADVLDEVVEGDTEHIVTSRAIQAELAKKLDWADLRNITLYQLMQELRFPWNMPTEMYFKLTVYAPLKEQDLAVYYPTLTQQLGFTALGVAAFVPTNKFPYVSYNSSTNITTYRDIETDRVITLVNSRDTSFSTGNAYYLSGYTSNATMQASTGADVQFTIYSKNPISITTLSQLSYKFKAYNTNESSWHNHINKIYVSTYISPDGVDWHQLQNKTIYNWDDNYDDLNDYIYLIPLLA